VHSLASENGGAASVLRVLTGVTVGEEVVERSTLYGMLRQIIYLRGSVCKNLHTSVEKIMVFFSFIGGHAVAQLVEALRYKPEVAGSIPDGVTGIFRGRNPSGRTMTLGLTQPLTEMSTRNIS